MPIHEVYVTIIENQNLVIHPQVQISRAYMAEWGKREPRSIAFNPDVSGIIYVLECEDWYSAQAVNAKWVLPTGNVRITGNPFTYEALDSGGRRVIAIGYHFEENANVRNHFVNNPGEWKVEIFIDNEHRVTLSFVFR